MEDIRIKMPEGFEEEILSLSKNLEWDKLVKRAIKRVLQEEIEEELLFEIAENIASKSQLSEEDADRFSEEIKDKSVKFDK